MIDTSLHVTRHTYTNVLERMNTSVFDHKRQIGHKVSSEAIGNYAGNNGQSNKQDMIQVSAIDKFEVIKTLKLLSQVFHNNYKGFGVSCWNGKAILEWHLFEILQQYILDNDKWSNEEESAYQSLLEEVKFKGDIIWDPKLNAMVEKKITPSDFTGRLKVLHNRREECFNSIVKTKLVKPKKANSISFEFEDPEWAKEARKEREKNLQNQ